MAKLWKNSMNVFNVTFDGENCLDMKKNPKQNMSKSVLSVKTTACMSGGGGGGGGGSR